MNIKNSNSLIDGIDKIILEHLMKNAKVSIQIIAKNIGISVPAIHQRIKKLERSGIISSSKIILDTKKIGYNTTAYVGVFMDKSSQYNDVISKMKEIPEIIEAHYTTGNYSIFIKILCRDNEHLMTILNKGIQNINGVIRTETFISLEQSINRQIKP